jgi:hypothetical protein
VLTILWLFAATSYFAFVFISQSYQAADGAREICLRLSTANVDCWQEWSDQLSRIDRGYYWRSSLGLAAALAALFWLVYAICFGAVKWILAGRRRPE